MPFQIHRVGLPDGDKLVRRADVVELSCYRELEAKLKKYKAQHRKDVFALDRVGELESELLATQHELALWINKSY